MKRYKQILVLVGTTVDLTPALFLLLNRIMKLSNLFLIMLTLVPGLKALADNHALDAVEVSASIIRLPAGTESSSKNKSPRGHSSSRASGKTTQLASKAQSKSHSNSRSKIKRKSNNHFQKTNLVESRKKISPAEQAKIDEVVKACVIDSSFDDKVAAIKRSRAYYVYRRRCMTQFPRKEPLYAAESLECVMPAMQLASDSIGVDFLFSHAVAGKESGDGVCRPERVQYLYEAKPGVVLNDSVKQLSSAHPKNNKTLDFDSDSLVLDTHAKSNKGAKGLFQITDNGAIGDYKERLSGNDSRFDCELYKANLAFFTAIGEAPPSFLKNPKSLDQEGLSHNWDGPVKFNAFKPTHNMVVGISYLASLKKDALAKSTKRSLRPSEEKQLYLKVARSYNAGPFEKNKRRVAEGNDYAIKIGQCIDASQAMIKKLEDLKLVEDFVVVQETELAAVDGDGKPISQ